MEVLVWIPQTKQRQAPVIFLGRQRRIWNGSGAVGVGTRTPRKGDPQQSIPE